ncbi:MAG: metallophosphoesterase, partial [Lachnospiraceae bacterium]|nr:metallophosphoesterase [Lachnospiraceae bacterium]
MSTYIMSDIHGCYDEFLHMLTKINFAATDQLILAGDYIDRGTKSYEMLKWIEHKPANVRLIRGNHEEEFAAYVQLMCQLNQQEELSTDFTSAEDTIILYETLKYFMKYKGLPIAYFDLYGTLENLLYNYAVTLNDLCKWADIIRRMPYYIELKTADKTYIIVHAG